MWFHTHQLCHSRAVHLLVPEGSTSSAPFVPFDGRYPVRFFEHSQSCGGPGTEHPPTVSLCRFGLVTAGHHHQGKIQMSFFLICVMTKKRSLMEVFHLVARGCYDEQSLAHRVSDSLVCMSEVGVWAGIPMSHWEIKVMERETVMMPVYAHFKLHLLWFASYYRLGAVGVFDMAAKAQDQ